MNKLISSILKKHSNYALIFIFFLLSFSQIFSQVLPCAPEAAFSISQNTPTDCHLYVESDNQDENAIHLWLLDGSRPIIYQSGYWAVLNGSGPYLVEHFITINGVTYYCAQEIELPDCSEMICDESAGFNYEINDCTVEFEANIDDLGSAHKWTFGDGSTGNGANPSHVFPTDNRLYRVCHTYCYLGEEITCCKEIEVNCDPNCEKDGDFVLVKTECNTILGYPFNLYCPDGSLGEHEWDFGDGTPPSTDPFPTHVYANDGSYTITHKLICDDIEISCSSLDRKIYCNTACCQSDEPNSADFTVVIQNNIGCFTRGDCASVSIRVIPSCTPILATHQWWFNGIPIGNVLMPLPYILKNFSTYSSPTFTIKHEVICLNGLTFSEEKTLNWSDFNIEGIYISDTDILSLVQNNVLDAGATTGKEVYINGILDSNSPTSYAFNESNLHMCPCSGIDVTLGEFKVANQTTITATCPQMWRGIKVDTRIVGENSTISDAMNAVFTGSTGVEMDFSSMNFTKNHIGILAQFNRDFVFTQFKGNTFDGSGPLKEICDDGFSFGPFSREEGFAGIFVQIITELSLPETSDRNTFKNLGVGLFIQNANANIRSCDFEDIDEIPFDENGQQGIKFFDTQGGHTLDVTVPSGSTDAYCSFTNCRYGIQATNSGSDGSSALINNTIMNNVWVGIEVKSGKDGNGNPTGNFRLGEIHNNSITDCANTGINIDDVNGNASSFNISQNSIIVNRASSPAPKDTGFGINIVGNGGILNSATIGSNNTITLTDGTHGINMESWNAGFISENTILTVNSNSSKAPRGINLENANNVTVCGNVVTGSNQGESVGMFVLTSEDGTYRGNTLSSVDISASFNDHCGIQADGIQCNTFIGNAQNKHGLLYNQAAVTGSQTNTGNKWQGSFSDNEAEHGDKTSDPMTAVWGQSRYRVVNGGSEMPNPVDPPAWFIGNQSTSPDCSGACSSPNPDNPSVSSTAIFYATSGHTTGEFAEEVNWRGQQMVYKKLSDYPELLSGYPELEEFMSEMENTALANLYQVRKGLKELFNIDEGTATQIQDNFDQITLSMSNIASIDKSMNAGVSENELDILLQQRSGYVATIENAVNANQGIQAQLISNRISASSAVVLLNDAIEPTNIHEMNEQKYLRAYLNTIAINEPLLTASEDFKNLVNIAHQCPIEGGKSVIEARSLIDGLYDTKLDGLNCYSQPFAKPVTAQELYIENDLIAVFPNPASESFKVVAKSLIFDESSNLKLINNLGKEIRAYDELMGLNEIEVKVENLPSGVYRIVLFKEGKAVESKSVIIQN